MALRIQRERMASGLLPSLREYAARYGLTRERLALARPGALVMHPGPMNEGVEIAADVAAGAQSVITDQVTNGVAVRMALLYLLAGTHPRRDRRRVSGHGPDLEISRAWLVDPAAGREGPGEIVVRDGILEAVTWLDGRRRRRDRRRRRRRRARASSTSTSTCANPATRMPRRWRRGLAAAAHGGFTTVCAMPNTTPALDEPGVLAQVRAAAVASGSPVELLAHGAVTVGRGGERLAALGELADAGVVGFSDDGVAGPVGVDPAGGARVRGRARAADRRPPRGRRP